MSRKKQFGYQSDFSFFPLNNKNVKLWRSEWFPIVFTQERRDQSRKTTMWSTKREAKVKPNPLQTTPPWTTLCRKQIYKWGCRAGEEQRRDSKCLIPPADVKTTLMQQQPVEPDRCWLCWKVLITTYCWLRNGLLCACAWLNTQVFVCQQEGSVSAQPEQTDIQTDYTHTGVSGELHLHTTHPFDFKMTPFRSLPQHCHIPDWPLQWDHIWRISEMTEYCGFFQGSQDWRRRKT